jgi:hypothetical protein
MKHALLSVIFNYNFNLEYCCKLTFSCAFHKVAINSALFWSNDIPLCYKIKAIIQYFFCLFHGYLWRTLYLLCLVLRDFQTTSGWQNSYETYQIPKCISLFTILFILMEFNLDVEVCS